MTGNRRSNCEERLRTPKDGLPHLYSDPFPFDNYGLHLEIDSYKMQNYALIRAGISVATC